MSGGQLVVLDQSGRDVKRYPLTHGLVKLGSDESSDIRIMLDTVDPHHATVVVHANQAVVRNVCRGEILVNGVCVSVAPLQHGDVISIGGRHLRWDYHQPHVRRAQTAHPALQAPSRTKRTRTRASCPASASSAPRRDRAVEHALEMRHRASMPGNAGGKQVAIVQPQRRDTHEQNDKPAARTPVPSNKRPRTSRNDLDVSVSDAEADKAKRKSSLQNTTKATLWIESRKSSPRSAPRQAPLPTPPQTPPRTPLNTPPPTPPRSPPRNTPRSAPGATTNQRARKNPASARKSTPLRLTVLKRAQSVHAGKVTKIEAPSKIDYTKQAALLLMTGHASKSRLLNSLSPNTSKSINKTISPKLASPKVTPKVVTRKGSLVVKKTPNRGRAVSASPKYRPISTKHERRSLRKISNRSNQKSTDKSPSLPSPKKSALKNPLTKKSIRKTESIKFDLSNLESNPQDSEMLSSFDTTQQTGIIQIENDFSLRYSTSGVQSPSPRRSIHSRSSKMLEKSIGTSITLSPPSKSINSERKSRSRTSSRGSMMLQKALDKSDVEMSQSSRTTNSLSDITDDTIASAFRTHTLTPGSSRNNLESYSIVDLVSVDSNESGISSVYNSVGSSSSITFTTPQNSVGRKTRSTIDPALLSASTPYIKITRMSNTSSNMTLTPNGNRQQSSRRSKSVSTPENKINVSANSTRISRVSRSRSRLKDSDLVLIEADDADESPRSSRRVSTASKRSNSALEPRNISGINTTYVKSSGQETGMTTPENNQSPEEASTPVLSIQSLLDSSRNSSISKSVKSRGRPLFKRKTIGALSQENKTRVSTKSNSRMTRSRLSDDSYENLNVSSRSSQNLEEVVTPKSEIKLVPEAVKNKHSTAKKPQSKRSIIDDLNESDIVKQLFNSPVKRKLSQSIREFSQKQLSDDDVGNVRKSTRNTIASTGSSRENSVVEGSEAFSQAHFVSTMSTPSHSPNLFGIKLMFGKNTPENDLRDVRGVKALLRTPSARKSIRNDLTNVSGVKKIFSKDPRNRLSDVRIKEIFATSVNNDLRRVSGVKSLFQSQKVRKSVRNSLGDVRGVKALFNRKSPVNDLRNVSGVKRNLQKSPKNDLSDVRGVKHLFARNKNELDDLSGIEELFNAEEWLQKTPEKSTNNRHSRELQKLATDTVEGTSPLRTSRVRNSTIIRTSIVEASELPKATSELYSSRKLPIKKRSVVNVSGNKSKDTSKSINLPLKKRAYELLHSTPVKGRQINMTMNVSELGRVSPIAPETTLQEKNYKTMSNLPIDSKTTSPKLKIVQSLPKKSIRTSKTTPIKDRSTTSKSKIASSITKSPLKPDTPKVGSRSTRSRKTVAVLSPKPTTSYNQKVVESSAAAVVVNSKSNSAARNNGTVIGKPKTPKNTRAKVQETTVVVKKPSPQIKPRARGRGRQTKPEISQVKEIVLKDKKVFSNDSPMLQNKRATLIVAKKALPRPRSARKSKQMEELTPADATVGRKTRNNRSKGQKVAEKIITPKNVRVKVQSPAAVVSKSSPQIKPRATRAKAQQSQAEVTNVVKGKKVSPKESPLQVLSPKDARKTRGRNTAANNASTQNNKVEQSQTKPRRGRKQIDKQESVEDDDKIQLAKGAAKTRKTNKEDVIPEGYKTKTSALNKQKREETVSKPAASKTDKQEDEEKVPVKTRRRKSPDNTESELLASTRSRRATKPNNTIIPVTNNRKRKSVAVDDRPTKVSKTAVPRGKKNESVATVASSRKADTKKNKVTKQGSGDAPSKVTPPKKAEVSVEAQKHAPRSTRAKKAVVVVESAKRKRKSQLELLNEASKKKPRGGKSPAKVTHSPKRTRTARAAATLEVSKSLGRSRRT